MDIPCNEVVTLCLLFVVVGMLILTLNSKVGKRSRKRRKSKNSISILKPMPNQEGSDGADHK